MTVWEKVEIFVYLLIILFGTALTISLVQSGIYSAVINRDRSMLSSVWELFARLLIIWTPLGILIFRHSERRRK